MSAAELLPSPLQFDSLAPNMNWSDWTGSENLKAIVRHTLHCTAAILSFMWIAWLVRWGLNDGWLKSFIEHVEQFVLAVLLLVFVIQIGYDLWKLLFEIWKEIKRNAHSNQIVFS